MLYTEHRTQNTHFDRLSVSIVKQTDGRNGCSTCALWLQSVLFRPVRVPVLRCSPLLLLLRFCWVHKEASQLGKLCMHETIEYVCRGTNIKGIGWGINQQSPSVTRYCTLVATKIGEFVTVTMVHSFLRLF
jgi:hypothetical protein